MRLKRCVVPASLAQAISMNQKNLNYEIETIIQSNVEEVEASMNQKNLNYEIETKKETVEPPP